MLAALVESTLALGNVFLLVVMILFLFALFGTQFLRDTMKYRCIDILTGYISPEDIRGGFTCSPNPNGIWGISARKCPTG
jgi:hypothetical protein